MKIYAHRSRLLLILFVLVLAGNTFSQSARELPFVNRMLPKNLSCRLLKTGVVSEADLKNVRERKRCELGEYLSVDFQKQTLILYRLGGDCHMRLDIKGIFREDEKKTVTVEIDNIWGGCRAGGWIDGFLVTEKIPDNYKVEINENLIDDRNYLQRNLLRSKIETSEIDLKGCIQMFNPKEFRIRSAEEYLKLIRKDAQQAACEKLVGSLDFEKYSYAGVLLRSGYCRVPVGLRHWGINDLRKGKFIINVRYTKPEVTCRALSRYELWLKLPKLSTDQNIEFDIQAES
ncbi:MAG: hypothetical protein R2681_18045 [Pyrinomonadaceae bacterium]